MGRIVCICDSHVLIQGCSAIFPFVKDRTGLRPLLIHISGKSRRIARDILLL